MKPIATTLAEHTRHDPTTECHVWTGKVNYAGYGRLVRQRRDIRAHRAAYELAKGPVPAGLELDHLCNNRRCINPAHLEPVTHAENLRRAHQRAKPKPRQTNCRRGHPIAKLDANGHAICTRCKNDRQNERRAARRAQKPA